MKFKIIIIYSSYNIITSNILVMNPNIAELHANSMQNIDKIKQLLAESDESGARTLEQLSIDKEKLLKIRKNVDEVDNKVGISRRIIRKMNWEDDKKKIVVGTGATVVTAGAITAAVLIKK